MELQSETILDLKAFNRLFGEYQQRFIRFAGTYVSDAATAEDIVMESFMAAWEKRDMLSASAFPPYALTIVKNKCLNYLKHLQVEIEYSKNCTKLYDCVPPRISTPTVRACSEPAFRPSKPATPRNCSARRRGGW